METNVKPALPGFVLLGEAGIILASATLASVIVAIIGAATPSSAQILRRDELVGRLQAHEDVEGVAPRIKATQTDGGTTYSTPLIDVPPNVIRPIRAAADGKYQLVATQSTDGAISFLLNFGLFEKKASLKVSSALLLPSSRLPLIHSTLNRQDDGYLNMNFFSLTHAQLRVGAKAGLKVKIRINQGLLTLAVPAGHVKALLAALS